MMNSEVFNCFPTHIEKAGPLLRICLQKDHKLAIYVENYLFDHKNDFLHPDNVPRKEELSCGSTCLGRYEDDNFYRIRILDFSLINNSVNVLFIDYGNVTPLILSDIRMIRPNPHLPLMDIPALAITCYLEGVNVSRTWSDAEFSTLRHHILYEERQCKLRQLSNGIKLVNIYIQTVGKYLTDMILHSELGTVISDNELVTLARGMLPSSRLQFEPDVTNTNVLRSNINSVHSRGPSVSGRLQIRAQGFPSGPPPLSQQYSVPSADSLPSDFLHRTRSHPQAPLMSSEALRQDSTYTAYISYVEDGPSSFSIQLKESAEMALPKLNALLMQHKPVPITGPLLPGAVVMCHVIVDNSFRRSVVMTVKGDSCKVYHVDYGSVEQVPYSHLFELPSQASHAPAMALRFCLADLGTIPLGEGAKAYFAEFLQGKQVLIKVTPQEKGGPLLQYCEMFYEGRSLKDILLALSSPLEYTNQHPPRGKDTKVIVSVIEGPSQFFVQYSSKLDIITSIQDAVNNYCQSQPRLTELDISIGSPVAALYEDNSWYRAMVVSMRPKGGIYNVLYVDYGNKSDVPVSLMCHLSRELVTKWRTQAVECCLLGFENVTPSPEAINKISQEALGKSYHMKLISLLSGSRLLVDLVDDLGKKLSDLMSASNNSNTTQPITGTESSKPDSQHQSDAETDQNKKTSGKFLNDNVFHRPGQQSRPTRPSGSLDSDKKSSSSGANDQDEDEWAEDRPQSRSRGGNSRPFERPPRFGHSDEDGGSKYKKIGSGRLSLSGGGGATEESWGGGREKRGWEGGKKDDHEGGGGGHKKWGGRDRGSSAAEDWETSKDTPANKESNIGGRNDDFNDRQPPKRNADDRPRRFDWNGGDDRNKRFGRNEDERPKRFDRNEEDRPKRFDRNEEDRPKRFDRNDDDRPKRFDRNEDDRPKRFDRNDDDRPKRFDRNDDDRSNRFDDRRGPKWGERSGGGGRQWGGCGGERQWGGSGGERQWGGSGGEQRGGGGERQWGGSGGERRGGGGGRFRGDSTRSSNYNADSSAKPFSNSTFNNDFDSSKVPSGKVGGDDVWDDEAASGPPKPPTVAGAAAGSVAGAHSSIGHYTEERFELGTILKVHVSTLLSPTLFYVQKAGSEADLDSVRQLIDSSLSSLVPVSSSSASAISLGTPVIAKFSEDQLLYRGLVKALKSPSAVEVLFVDYGNSGEAALSELYQLSSQRLAELAPLALRCTLPDLCEDSKSSSSDTVLSYLQFDSPLSLTVLSLKMVDGQLELGVSLTSPTGESISQNLVAAGLASFKAQTHGSPVESAAAVVPPGPSVEPLSDDWVDSMDLFVGQQLYAEILSEEKEENLYVIRIVAAKVVTLAMADQEPQTLKGLLYPGMKIIVDVKSARDDRLHVTFYDMNGDELGKEDENRRKVSPVCEAAVGRRRDQVFVSHCEGNDIWLQRSAESALLADLVDRLYEACEEDSSAEQRSAGCWTVGSLCCAKSAQDGNWYRARLLTENTVRFIDYGNSETLPPDHLTALDKQFQDIPELALSVTLAVTWHNTSASFMEHVDGQEFISNIMRNSEGRWVADLTFPNGENIKKLIVEKNLGVPFCENPFDEINGTIGADLKSGDRLDVIVSHVDSPGMFWAHKCEHIGRIEEMQQAVQGLVQSATEASPESSCAVLACQYAEDGIWYRASPLDQHTIRFIDYGNTSQFSGGKQLPPDLVKPRSGYAIPMYFCVKPNGGQDWCEEAMKTFEGFIEQALKVEVINVNYRIVVDLRGEEGSLSELFIKSGYGEYHDYVPLSVKTPNVPEHCLKDTLVSETDHLPLKSQVYVSFAQSVNDFYIQEESVSLILDEICVSLSALQQNENIKNPDTSQLYAAKCPDDDMWYRAKILNTTEGKSSVKFVDYGNTSTVTELRSLPEDLKNIPYQCQHCSLDIAQTEESFSNFQEIYNLGLTPFTVSIKVEGSPSIVELRDSQGTNILKDVAPSLLNCEKEAEDGSKTVERKDEPQVASSVQKNEKNGPKENEDTAETNGEVFQNNIQQPKELMEVKKTSKNGEKIENNVIVCHSNGPYDFYVQTGSHLLEAENLIDMMETASEFNKLDSVNEGDVVAALLEEDGCWYRSVVLRTQPELTVHFIDYGNISPVTEIRELPAKIKEMPLLSYHCSLVGEVEGWGSEAIDLFTSICAQDGIEGFGMELLSEGDPRLVELYKNGSSVTSRLLTASQLKKGFMTYIISVEDFYLQDVTCVQHLDEISVELMSLQDDNTTMDLHKGDLVAVKSAEDLSWYRGRVVEDSPKVLINFIDYGSVGDFVEVTPLSEKLLQIKPLAVRCSLALPGPDYFWNENSSEVLSMLAKGGSTEFYYKILTTLPPHQEKTIIEMIVDGKNIADDLSTLVPRETAEVDVEAQDVESKAIKEDGSENIETIVNDVKTELERTTVCEETDVRSGKDETETNIEVGKDKKIIEKETGDMKEEKVENKLNDLVSEDDNTSNIPTKNIIKESDAICENGRKVDMGDSDECKIEANRGRSKEEEKAFEESTETSEGGTVAEREEEPESTQDGVLLAKSEITVGNNINKEDPAVAAVPEDVVEEDATGEEPPPECKIEVERGQSKEEEKAFEESTMSSERQSKEEEKAFEESAMTSEGGTVDAEREEEPESTQDGVLLAKSEITVGNNINKEEDPLVIEEDGTGEEPPPVASHSGPNTPIPPPAASHSGPNTPIRHADKILPGSLSGVIFD